MPSMCRNPEWLVRAKPRLLLLLMKESKKLMILLGGKRDERK